MRLSAIAIVTGLCLVFGTGGSLAGFGLGGFVQGAQGSGELESDTTPELDVDTGQFGFGIVLDTDISDRSVFNYRLNVGLEAQELEFEGSAGDVDLSGIAIDNNFGFAVFRRPEIRVWVGPQVRFAFYNGETSVGDFDVYAVSFGAGPVVGGNFVLNERVAFSVSGGVRFTGILAQVDFPDEEEDFDGVTTAGFVNFSVLFGFGR